MLSDRLRRGRGALFLGCTEVSLVEFVPPKVGLGIMLALEETNFSLGTTCESRPYQCLPCLVTQAKSKLPVESSNHSAPFKILGSEMNPGCVGPAALALRGALIAIKRFL